MTLASPLYIERPPFFLEAAELRPNVFYASIWRVTPERRMIWLSEAYDTEIAAIRAAKPHFDALIPRALSFTLTSQFSFSVSELPSLVAILERSGRHDEAQRVQNVLELMGQRIEEAVA